MGQRTPGRSSLLTGVALGAASGVAIEIGIGAASHRREAWDSGLYWSMGLPLMLLAALVCGFVARRRAAVTGYSPFAGGLAAMVVKTGTGSMLPLGVIFMAVVGLSGVAAAFVGGMAGRWMLGVAEQGGRGTRSGPG